MKIEVFYLKEFNPLATMARKPDQYGLVHIDWKDFEKMAEFDVQTAHADYMESDDEARAVAEQVFESMQNGLDHTPPLLIDFHGRSMCVGDMIRFVGTREDGSKNMPCVLVCMSTGFKHACWQ